MGLNSVDMDLALTSESYAARCIRSGIISDSERIQLINTWGSDKVKLWESVDNTQYKISDEKWDGSKEAAKEKAKEATGHDGSKQNKGRIVGDAIGAAANGALAFCGEKIGNWMGKGAMGKFYNNVLSCNKKGTNLFGKNITKKQSPGKNLSDIMTVIIGSAEAIAYQVSKPNKDQHDAAMKLYDAEKGEGGLLIEGQDSLEEAEAIMEEATEETAELTDEAQEINDEANENIEDDKTNFDFYRKQYDRIKAKAASGEQLTPEEKQIIQKVTPLMEEAKANIEGTQEEASTGLEDKNSEIQNFQSQYDEGAETIAEVQGLTEYAAGFDSDTKTSAIVEGVSLGISAVTTGAAAARLATKGGLTFGATLVFAAMGAAAAVRLGTGTKEQIEWAGHLNQEINFREATEELGAEAEGVYQEELDNFTGNMEIIEDMEIEVPEDLNLPDQNPAAGDVQAFGNTEEATLIGNDGEEENGSAENPEEEDSEYANVMGRGADYSDIVSGKVKRGANDQLVTDANGKVVLLRSYADAITKVTGDSTGEGYNPEKVPEILAELLGDPFTVEMINNVRNGGTLDSSYDAKLKKTMTGEETGEKVTVDNSGSTTAKARNVINFYWPIFERASKGWVQK